MCPRGCQLSSGRPESNGTPESKVPPGVCRRALRPEAVVSTEGHDRTDQLDLLRRPIIQFQVTPRFVQWIGTHDPRVLDIRDVLHPQEGQELVQGVRADPSCVSGENVPGKGISVILEGSREAGKARGLARSSACSAARVSASRRVEMTLFMLLPMDLSIRCFLVYTARIRRSQDCRFQDLERSCSPGISVSSVGCPAP